MPLLKKHEGKRAKQDRELRTALEEIDAQVFFSTPNSVRVVCKRPEDRSRAREIISAHGFII